MKFYLLKEDTKICPKTSFVKSIPGLSGPPARRRTAPPWRRNSSGVRKFFSVAAILSHHYPGANPTTFELTATTPAL
jgi:hypothetical protein